jgi:histidinol dehydrogenase
MRIYASPNNEIQSKLVFRPNKNATDLSNLVSSIFEDVKMRGDEAVDAYCMKYDGFPFEIIDLDESIVSLCDQRVETNIKQAIDVAYRNIYKFHNQTAKGYDLVETMSGVQCWYEIRAIENVGLYIPGGSAPLFSTLLMLGIPALIAGCREIVVVTPKNRDGEVDPLVLYTAYKLGLKRVYAVGGIQAIAAMSFGTNKIPRVSKILGPGNSYVMAAKMYAQSLGVAIDMPAGPSEVLVIADGNADPSFVAADLISQAEHGADSQVVLLTNSDDIIDNVLQQISSQLKHLERADIAKSALDNSFAIKFDTIEDCIVFSNNYAPEHLILNFEHAEQYVNKIINAGSVFIGPYSCESFGDYASGTNHTLPTNSYSKAYSGVSVDSFNKKISFQKVNAQGLVNLGHHVEHLAAAEGLDGHKNAVSIRLKTLNL